MSMIKAGSTNVVRYFMMRKVSDGTAFTGATITTFDLQYTLDLTASATKIDAIVGTGGATTHVDNKVFELDSTSSPGLYMVCFPDAAFATGPQVTLTLKYDATVFTEAQNIQLVAFDPFDTVRLGLTALPDAAADAAGGLVISDAGGYDIDNSVGTRPIQVMEIAKDTTEPIVFHLVDGNDDDVTGVAGTATVEIRTPGTTTFDALVNTTLTEQEEGSYLFTPDNVAETNTAGWGEITATYPGQPSNKKTRILLHIVDRVTTAEIQTSCEAANAADGLTDYVTDFNTDLIEDDPGTPGTNRFTLNSLDQIFAFILENSETFAEQIRLIRAEASGLVVRSGDGLNVKFRDAADTKDRIDATVDADGNRTAITTDGN